MAPYEQSIGKVLFWGVFALFALGEYVMQFRTGFKRTGKRVERWTLYVVIACTGVGLVAGFRLAHWDAATVETARWALFAAGILVMVSGVLLRQWAIFTLGSYFTVDVRVRSDQQVIDRGPCRFVRHPSYTGLIVFFVGVGLALTNWASLIVLAVVPTAGLLVRIRAEERALSTGLGDDYRRYAAGRPRLFPGIW